MDKGFVKIKRQWHKGDVIELNMPMPIRRVLAHENVLDDRGKAALQRGPIVYCAEAADYEDGKVLNLMLPDDAELAHEFRADLLGGVGVIKGKARVVRRTVDVKLVADVEKDFMAIPYYAWAHRKRGEMTVWVARELSAAKPAPIPTIANASELRASGGTNIAALNDQLQPRSSDDHAKPFFHWWPQKGSLEWVQYDFAKVEKVASVDVYWFDDTGIGECRIPASWRILDQAGEQWKVVENHQPYTVEIDTYNKMTFAPVEAVALRLEVQLPPRFSAGIHEWIVK